MHGVKCSSCGGEIQGRDEPRCPCLTCGSTNRIISVTVEEYLSVYDGLAFRQTGQKQEGKRGIVAEGFVKYVGSKLAALVRHERSINRRDNRYFEKVSDAETGKVIHECSEPLSQHQGHGSAKKIR
jgi:hypothetical protein